MDYTPHTSEDIARMKASVGIAGIEELFADIPAKYRLNRLPDIPSALSEQETVALMNSLSRENKLPQMTLTGAGAYHHFIPCLLYTSEAETVYRKLVWFSM